MSLATSGDVPQQGVEVLRNRAADLYAAVENALRQHVFDNVRRLASVRPLPATSQTIVDAFLQYLVGKLPETEIFRRVADLVGQGLGPRSALAVIDHLTWASLAMLEADSEQFWSLWPTVDAFRMQFELSYIQARTDEILREQERIHHGLTQTLEKQIAVEQRLRAELQRRQSQLQTAVQVSRAASSILDLGKLLSTSVNLIRERFDLYYVGLFLVGEDDESREWAILHAGTGEAGQEMLRQGHRLRIGGRSMVGQCIAHNQACIALDTGTEAVRFDNPLLPRTRSEMALPLVSRGQVIGAMTIQSDRVAAFSDMDIAAFEALTGQLANAIQNARLFEQTQVALQELETVQRRYMGQAWQAYAVAEEAISGYQRTVAQAGPTDDAWLPAMTTSLQQRDVVIERGEEGGAMLALPLTLSGEVIGALGGYSPTVEGWSQEEIAAAKAIVEQMALALESQRLFDEEQRARALLGMRVKELDCLNDIGRKMDESLPVPEFLQWVAGRIPAAMQFPDLAVVAINFDGDAYGQAEALTLPWQMVQSLRIGGEEAGRVCIAYREPRDFLNEESALLGDITRRLSSYVEHQRLLEEIRSHAEELAVLNDLALALTARLDVDQVLQEAYRGASRLLDATNFYIGLYEADEHQIHFRLDVTESVIEKEITTLPADTGITGYIVRTGEKVLIKSDVSDWLAAHDIPLVGEMAASWLGVPLLIGDQVLGVMVVQSFTTPNLYDEHDLDLMMAIASQSAIAIQNARLFEETQAALDETATLFRIARGLAQAQSQQEMFELVLVEYLRALDLPQGGVMTLDREGNQGTLHALVQDGQLVEAGLRIPIVGNPPTERALATQEPVVIRDARHDELTAPTRDLVDQLGYKSLLLVPIVVRGEAIGLLGADSVDEIHEFTEGEINLVRAVADQLGIAMENQRLLEEARAALAEVEATHRSYLRRGWQEFLRQQETLARSGFLYDRSEAAEDVVAVPSLWRPEIERALAEGSVAIARGSGDDGERAGLAIPITLRGQTIGVLGVEAPDGDSQWTEDDIALVEAIGDQLGQALESARLFADTQRRAERERLISEITAKIRASTDIQDILETTAMELGRALGTSRTLVRLGPAEEQGGGV